MRVLTVSFSDIFSLLWPQPKASLSYVCPGMNTNEMHTRLMKRITVRFSYHFIFDITMCLGDFVMVITKCMHFISVHSWIYLKIVVFQCWMCPKVASRSADQRIPDPEEGHDPRYSFHIERPFVHVQSK